jgi:hypothetical protein
MAQPVDSWAILLNSPLSTGQSNLTSPLRRAALVSIHRSEGNILYAKFRCAASVFPANAGQNFSVEDMSRNVEDYLRRNVTADQILLGFEVDEGQKWCVG